METSAKTDTGFKAKYGPYIACAALSCTFMVPVNIAPGIADMIAAFGSPRLVTLMMTIGPLFSIPATLISGKLSERIPKKTLALIGMSLILIFGILPAWMGGSLIAINAMRAIQGIGLGIVFSVAPSIPADYFPQGASRNLCLGIHGAFAGGGMFVYNYLAGWLVTINVSYIFLTYLMTIPLLILVWVFMPKLPPIRERQNELSQAEDGAAVRSFDKRCIPFTVDIFLFLIVVMACTLDTSNYIVGYGIGTAIDAGLTTTIFSISAFAGGLLFPVITGKLKNYTRPFGTLLVTAGLVLYVCTGKLLVTQMAAVVAGFGVSMHNPANINSAQNRVNPMAITMSIAIIGTANTLGQTLSTYVVSALAGIVGGSVVSRFYVSAVLAAILLVYESAFAARHKDI